MCEGSLNNLGEVRDDLHNGIFVSLVVNPHIAQVASLVESFDNFHELDLGNDWVIKALLEQGVLCLLDRAVVLGLDLRFLDLLVQRDLSGHVTLVIVEAIFGFIDNLVVNIFFLLLNLEINLLILHSCLVLAVI